MFVKTIYLSKKTISTENGNYKIPFEPGNLVHSSGRRQNHRRKKYEWQNIRYKIDPATKEIEEDRNFVHYPIKLA
jgi:hypothetical protein